MEALIAVVSVLIGGTISMLTQLISHRREDRREAHIRRDKQAESLAALYEEAVFNFDSGARKVGRGTQEDADSAVRILARMRLCASTHVLDQYLVVANALDEWTTAARNEGPQPIAGGIAIYKVTFNQKGSQADANWPKFVEEFEKLQRIMREHLRTFGVAA